MKCHEAKEMMLNIFGQFSWRGSQATCWKYGDHVLKVCVVSIKTWRSMRILSRRKGPYAQLIDMKVLGQEDGMVVGLMIQKFVGSHEEHRMINFQWFDGVDGWMQRDAGEHNAIKGTWVDLGDVEVINRRHLHEEPVDRLIQMTKLNVFPLTVSTRNWSQV